MFLFDLDGTLAESGCQITTKMIEALKILKNRYDGCQLGIVGGGKLAKIEWQLGPEGIDLFDYLFTECGAIVYYRSKLIAERNMMDVVNRRTLNEMLRVFMKFVCDLDIPIAGQLIDRRQGLYYLSPVGMQATQAEREVFIRMEAEHHLCERLIKALRTIDQNNEFDCVQGGSVGVAVYPKGWDKSQVVEYFKDRQIVFFGDRTESGGNDYPLYSHPKVRGYSVKNYQETIDFLELL